MPIKPSQLAGRRNLAPITLVAGDEPLQRLEALDLLRARAREQGYVDREVFDADGPRFDWQRLLAAGASLSLFAERRLFELRLGNGAVDKQGSEALQQLVAEPPPDVVVIAACDRYDKTVRNSRWCQAIEQAGTVVEALPVPVAALPRWVEQRMRGRGLEPDAAAVQLLVERVEGNLVAAAQEIDKLLLLDGPGAVGVDAVLRAVTDSARFDVYDLVDALLDGDVARTQRILDGLHGEGLAEPLLVWALARQLRELAAVSSAVDGGRPVGAALEAARVWGNRKSRVAAALRRGTTAGWRQGLRDCALADRMAKGRAPGDAWLQLRQTAIRLAGGPDPAAGMKTN